MGRLMLSDPGLREPGLREIPVLEILCRHRLHQYLAYRENKLPFKAKH